MSKKERFFWLVISLVNIAAFVVLAVSGAFEI